MTLTDSINTGVTAAPLWGVPSQDDSVEVLSARSELLVNTAMRLLSRLERTTEQVRSCAPPATRMSLLEL